MRPSVHACSRPAHALCPPQDKGEVLSDVCKIISEQLGTDVAEVRRYCCPAAAAATAAGWLPALPGKLTSLFPCPPAAGQGRVQVC